jgi:hypothetical protein
LRVGLTAGAGGIVGQVHVGMGNAADRFQGFFYGADARRAGGAGDRQLNSVAVIIAGVATVAGRFCTGVCVISNTFFAAKGWRCAAGTATFGLCWSGIKNLCRIARFSDSAGSVRGVNTCGQGDGFLLDVHIHRGAVGDQGF